MKEVTIKLHKSIIENKELNSGEKLILSLDYSLSTKLGYNAYTNKDMAELFAMNVNTVGKYRNSLFEKGFVRKEQNGYYITDKYKQTKAKDRRDPKLPPDVYRKKINTGAKLLWGEYNSLSNKGKKESFAKRGYLANRLNCSEDSITNWFNELVKNDLLSDYRLIGGKGSRQRRVKTVDFSKGSKSTIPVAMERRKEIWNEYIGNKSYLKKHIKTDKDIWEFTKELSVTIRGNEDQREIISSLLYDLESKMKGTDKLDSLRLSVDNTLREILKEI